MAIEINGYITEVKFHPTYSRVTVYGFLFTLLIVEFTPVITIVTLGPP